MLKELGAAAAVVAVVAGSALAQTPLSDEVEEPAWTSERFRDVEPMELPTLDAELGDLEEFAPLWQRGRRFFMPGSDAPAPIEPSQTRLFGTDDDAASLDEDAGVDEDAGEANRRLWRAPLEPFDLGTSGAPFSSSRLIPQNARLVYPYRAAGRLFGSSPQGDFSCSAALISPRLLLTAGHCVHEGGGGVDGFFFNFVFVPAYHVGEAPYRIWRGRAVWTTGSWGNDGELGISADFGIIELRDRMIGGRLRRAGEVVGWFGAQTFALLGNHTKKIGYPGEFDRGEVMHQVDSQTAGQLSAQTSCDGTDMTQGSSGGPWVENFGRKSRGQGDRRPVPNVIVGVTSFGPSTPGNPEAFGCSSIPNDEFAAMVQAACARRGGNC